jgi:rubrerythrin
VDKHPKSILDKPGAVTVGGSYTLHVQYCSQVLARWATQKRRNVSREAVWPDTEIFESPMILAWRIVSMSNSDGLSAVFSNLAKASEKQHLPESSALLSQLAERFTGGDTPGDDLSELRDHLVADVENWYPAVNKGGTDSSDRGVLRAARWGEKVTKAQRGLIDRYASKGEELLADADLYICEACGFIFVGTQAPEICPVCKAPSPRFSLVK